MEAENDFWKTQWRTWFQAQTAEIQEAYLTWGQQWRTWFHAQTTDMQETGAFWKRQWEEWFYYYVNSNTSEMADWRKETSDIFRKWFDDLRAMLENDVAASLANQLLALEKRTEKLEVFAGNLTTEFAIYHELYDNGYRTYDNLLDSSGSVIMDSDLGAVIGRTCSSDLILDSAGDPIGGRVIFVTK